MYTRLLVATAVVIALLAGVYVYGNSQYARGFATAESKFAVEIANKNAEYQKKQYEASLQYERELSELRNRKEVQYATVEKIVTRPVYLRECLDDDGVRLINKAAKHK